MSRFHLNLTRLIFKVTGQFNVKLRELGPSAKHVLCGAKSLGIVFLSDPNPSIAGYPCQFLFLKLFFIKIGVRTDMN